MQRARLSGPLAAEPVEQRRPVTKQLADGFEYYCWHERTGLSGRPGRSLYYSDPNGAPRVANKHFAPISGAPSLMPSLASSREIKAGDLSATAPMFSSDPEFRFLLSCCAVGTPSDNYERDGRSSLDWQRLLRLAEHHGVTPLVYRALRDVDAGIPAPIQGELRQRYEGNAKRNLVFVGELIRILDCLEAQAIDAIPYKGSVLAEAVYGDLALREFYDLDVL